MQGRGGHCDRRWTPAHTYLCAYDQLYCSPTQFSPGSSAANLASTCLVGPCSEHRVRGKMVSKRETSTGSLLQEAKQETVCVRRHSVSPRAIEHKCEGPGHGSHKLVAHRCRSRPLSGCSLPPHHDTLYSLRIKMLPPHLPLCYLANLPVVSMGEV